MVRQLQFHRRHIADRFQQPAMIEPVDPFQGCVLDGLQMAPRLAMMNDLRLEQPNDGFGQRVVVGITDAADRRLASSLGQALGIAK